ncbi:MAG TPA: hypothetical protein PLO59_08795, partial [Bacteroidia bacterium]|nr:hypothetical protein [Bacteroidia bacterium]
RVHPLLFRFAFMVKVTAGFILTLIYTHYYTDRSTADIFKYFDDSKIMYDLCWVDFELFLKMLFGFNDVALAAYYNQMIAWYDSDFIYNDNRLMIKLNCLMRFVSFGNYYIHVVLICFIVFYGLTCLFKLFASELKSKFSGIYFCAFFIPSVVFWTSAVLKDAAILFALSVFLFNYNKILINAASVKSYILLLLAILLLLTIKVYVFVLVLPGLIIVTLLKRKFLINYNQFAVWVVTYFIYAVVIFSLKYFTPYNIVEQIAIKQHQFLKLAYQVHSGSILKAYELSTSVSLIKAMPLAFCNTFLQPYVGNFKSAVITLASIENALCLLALIFVAFHSRLKNAFITPWFFFSLFFVLSLYSLIGLIVPVAGALVRYKTIAMPFFAFILLIIADTEKIKATFRKLKILN